MIGILFIYWIWKAFSELAAAYDKNKWAYFFIGLGSYYGTTFVTGFLYGIIVILIYGADGVNAEDYNNIGFNLIFVAFGGIACYGVYKLLENRGEKELLKKEGIDSIGLTKEN